MDTIASENKHFADENTQTPLFTTFSNLMVYSENNAVPPHNFIE